MAIKYKQIVSRDIVVNNLNCIALYAIECVLCRFQFPISTLFTLAAFCTLGKKQQLVYFIGSQLFFFAHLLCHKTVCIVYSISFLK